MLPDTPLYDDWQAGRYQPLDVETAAVWCADMLEVFEQEGIAVIRVGLNPTEELDSTVAAGAYHPAMGELAYSELWYRRLCRQIRETGERTITVPQRELSRAIGHKKRNVLRLREQFGDIRITAQENNL